MVLNDPRTGWVPVVIAVATWSNFRLQSQTSFPNFGSQLRPPTSDSNFGFAASDSLIGLHLRIRRLEPTLAAPAWSSPPYTKFISINTLYIYFVGVTLTKYLLGICYYALLRWGEFWIKVWSGHTTVVLTGLPPVISDRRNWLKPDCLRGIQNSQFFLLW